MGFLILMWVSKFKSTGCPKCGDVFGYFQVGFLILMCFCFFKSTGSSNSLRVSDSGKETGLRFFAMGIRVPSFPWGVSRSTRS